MQDSQYKFRIFLNEKILYKFVIIYLLWWYLNEAVHDVFIIFRNLKKDTKKYKLNVFSILYNTLIKYPFMGFLPSSYFKHKLYENSYNDYLSFCKVYPVMIKKNRRKLYLFDNKLLFKLHLENKIEQSKLVAFYNHLNKKIIHYAKPSKDKVVLKPVKGSRGKGIKIVSSAGFEEVLKKYRKSYIVEDFIEQHHFLNDIFSESVNTTRVLTLKNKEKIEVISMILKVGRSSSNHVDNIISGGIPIFINLESGMLSKAHFYKDHDHIEYKSHPETKFEFYKKMLPFFKEIKEIAINAHQLFPSCAIIGWDIAITENGPVIVEGNGLPDVANMQICDPLKDRLEPLFEIKEKDKFI